jgi:hypothetical protein
MKASFDGQNKYVEQKQMSKRHWMPILMGAGTAAIGFLITYADLTIYIGRSRLTGMPVGYDGREIFMTISAALGGPIAVLVSILQFPFIGTYMSLPATGVAIVMADRLTANITVAFLYKFIHKRIRKLHLFLLLWAVAIWAYYVIMINIEIVLGCLVSNTNIIAAYQRIGLWAATNPFLNLEPPLTYLFSVLILLAIPARLRRPLWIQPKEPAAENNYSMREEPV